MTTPGIARSERRAWRAVLFGLAVLAQMLLPAIVLRAQAVAGELCVTGEGSDAPASPGHAHDQQCAHCRMHNCASLPPPSVSVVAIARIDALAPPAVLAAMPVTAHRGQPPPTGPPAV